jgi:hypothetical protein
MTKTAGKRGVIGGSGDVLSVTTGLFLIHARDGVYDVEYAQFMCPGGQAEMFIQVRYKLCIILEINVSLDRLREIDEP